MFECREPLVSVSVHDWHLASIFPKLQFFGQIKIGRVMLRKIKSITINLYVAQYEITQKTLPQILLTICRKNCNLGNIEAQGASAQ